MATQTADDSLSLRDHEASFPTGTRQPRPQPEPAVAKGVEHPDLGEDAQAQAKEDFLNAQDPMRRFRKPEEEDAKPRRHRAKGDLASADDVPVIKALSAELDQVEAEYKTVKPDTGTQESPRARNLRLKIRGLRAEIDEAKPKPQVVAAREPVVVAEPDATWNEVEPKFEDFQKDPAKYPDAYGAWLRATAEFDRKKAQFETDQQNGVAQKARQSQEADALVRQQFDVKRDAFKATHPDYETKWKAAMSSGYDIPKVVTKIVLTDDNGPALVYSLLNNPAEMDRLMTLYEDKPVTDGLTARVRRELLAFHARQSAGTTGAATMPTRTRTFTPPTPVRTTPMQTGDEPPDEGSSLAEHERFYKRQSRR